MRLVDSKSAEACGYIGAKDLVERRPAADVAPVRHGRWIKHEGYDECSECHAKSIIGHNYCHSCGAQMGKEDKHEVS